MKKRNYIKSIALFGLDKLETPKMPLSTILKGMGISANAHKCVNSYIEFNTFIDIIEIAAQVWKRPNLGFEWGQLSDTNYPGISGLLIMAKFNKTIGDFAENLSKLMHFHTNGHRISFHRKPQTNTLIARTTYLGGVKKSEHLNISGAINLIKGVQILSNNSKLSPNLVQFSHKCPNDIEVIDKLKRHFGCEVVFGSRYDEIVFDGAVYDYELSGNLEFLGTFFHSHLIRRAELTEARLSKLSECIEVSIPMFWGTKISNFETMAEFFGMNSKKLQRTLSYENTNYKSLLVNTRVKHAKFLLKETDLPINSVAEILNYGGIAQFSSAFKRMTGYSPNYYRTRT